MKMVATTTDKDYGIVSGKSYEVLTSGTLGTKKVLCIEVEVADKTVRRLVPEALFKKPVHRVRIN